MFDISVGKLAIIGAVALVVIGPEKLPALARTVGVWFVRVRRFLATVKADFDREFQVAEVVELHTQMRQDIKDIVNEAHTLVEDTGTLLSHPVLLAEDTQTNQTQTNSGSLSSGHAEEPHTPPPDSPEQLTLTVKKNKDWQPDLFEEIRHSSNQDQNPG